MKCYRVEHTNTLKEPIKVRSDIESLRSINGLVLYPRERCYGEAILEDGFLPKAMYLEIRGEKYFNITCVDSEFYD